jgi:cation/acetate symporter
MAIIIFLFFVGIVIGLSFYLGKQAKSSSGFFAAGGRIHWAVNGIAFAGDYLSAASFLGIAGMIATFGYDGFLYSIGFLAGWIVALFIVAEPIKKLGKYTFTDALDAKFNSKGIQLAAAISTLIVSVFYLIPQMVGAGSLITPLFGFPHWAGVLLVGGIVITIVATAGMASTTYVQFIKGALLLIFSTILVVAVLKNGLTTNAENGLQHDFKQFTAQESYGDYTLEQEFKVSESLTLVKLSQAGESSWWRQEADGNGGYLFKEAQTQFQRIDGTVLINGAPESAENQLLQVGEVKTIQGDADKKTGGLGPLKFTALLGSKDTLVEVWRSTKVTDGEDKVTVYYPEIIEGNKVMRPGLKFKVEGTPVQKLDFASLMLALFCGTSALPHILIRYYTVPNPASARKSTLVAITAIGFFYLLTLYLGLGAMVSGVVNPADSNMSAPLLAQLFGTFLFASITAIAFSTVLGTVCGLIIAASGAVAHDIMDRFAGIEMDEKQKVLAGKVAAIVVGVIAIILGVVFKGVNVSFLVGLAFAVAASANFPAIIMLLFWKKTTAKGIIASITVGIVVSVGLILFSPNMYNLYQLNPADAPIQLTNPGIVAIPLSFITLVAVSLLTQKKPVEVVAPAYD